MITVRSSFGHGETLARLEAAVRANGMSAVARVDHADGALEISVSLDATTLRMWLAARYGARRDDVYLFTDMAVMIDVIARKAASPP